MVIYPYSIPAILALVGKIVILVFSRHSKVKNVQTRLFEAAVLLSVALSLAELAGFQRLFESSPHYEGFIYFAVSIPMIALLAHLGITVSYDFPHSRTFLPLYFVIYGYALVLEYLIFTGQVIVGMEPFKGYSMTRIPGPMYWLYETFLVGGLLIILLVPLGTLTRNTSQRVLSQCKLWCAAAAPLVLLLIVIVVLLHLEIQLFNSTVTTPLLITSFLAAVGYVIHSPHIVEIDFYLPWGATRKRKMGLYAKLAALNQKMPQLKSLEEIITRLAETLGCPVCFIGNQAAQPEPSDQSLSFAGLPIHELRKIGQLITVDQARVVSPMLYGLMQRHGVAAIVPFYPGSARAASWLLLGQPFDQAVFSSRDFKVIGSIFRTMANVLIDRMLEADTAKWHGQPRGDQQKSLQDLVQQFEAEVIEAALNDCKGNQAQAARLLGLRPNTLHYKLKRYGLQENSLRPPS